MKKLILFIFFNALIGCNKPHENKAPETLGSEVVGVDTELSQYFTYKDNYHCKTKLGKYVKSYVDSIYFDGEKVCRTGDLCTSKVECKSKSQVSDLKLSDDNLEVFAFGLQYVYGADLTANGGLPDLDQERQVASVEYYRYSASNESQGPSRPVTIIIVMWIFAFGMMLFMHFPMGEK